MSGWHWPQWVEAALLTLGVIQNISLHGKPKGEYDGPLAFISASIIVLILWAGGFWL